MDGHLPACRGFWLWALPGAMLCFSALSALSIGIFVAPFAALAVIAVSRWEERRRQTGLQQRAVERLQRQVAAVGVLAPGPGDLVRLRGGLERAVQPAEPAGSELLARHPHALEAGSRAQLAQLPGREGVHVNR